MNKGEGVKDKGGITLSVQGRHRNKVSDDYVYGGTSNEITWLHTIDLIENYIFVAFQRIGSAYTDLLQISHFPTTTMC